MRTASVLFCAVTLSICSQQAAVAQPVSDRQACATILAKSRSGHFFKSGAGLYISYRGTAEPMLIGATPVPYRPDARLYFVPSGRAFLVGNRAEGVWHIRTQTTAANASGADMALVYRPPVITRCSRGLPLPAFDSNHLFTPLNSYIDHHPSPDEPSRPDPSLSKYFHFRIQDPTQPDGCVQTDNRQVFRNLKDIYGFKAVIRTEEQVAQWLTFAPSVKAAEATDYAGLSSEFAYLYRAEPACFGFTVPVPTKSWGISAHDWIPLQTSIVIKRLRGRAVLPVAHKSITWTR
jgi:hypothetical protein